jgi:hypothetical protein
MTILTTIDLANVFASEIDTQGRRVVSPLAMRDFPYLFDGVDVVEVDYEPVVNEFEMDE